MIINKKSWHYRMASIPIHYIPDNLCGYAKTVMLGTFLFTLITSLMLGAVVNLLLGLALAIGGYWEWQSGIGVSNILIIGVCIWGVQQMWGSDIMDYIHSKLPERYDARLDSHVKKPPSLFAMYYKSLKDKTCIMLEFKK